MPSRPSGAGLAGILALLGVGCSLATSRLRCAVGRRGRVGGGGGPGRCRLKLNIVVAIAAAVVVCLIAEAHGPRWLRGAPIPFTVRMADLNPWTLLTFVALAAVTVITRGFFFLSDRPRQLPHWAERGLQHWRRLVRWRPSWCPRW